VDSQVAVEAHEPVPATIEPAEATQIRQALAQTGGNVVRAARLLGVSRDTVRYRMQRYGITRLRSAAPPTLDAAEPETPVALQMPTMESLPPMAPSPGEPSAPPGQDVTLPPVVLPPHEAERRYLTVLFCDLVDSARLVGQLDPEDVQEVVRLYHHTCATAIQRFDGYVTQYGGDDVVACFGYPLAHEDDAQRAV
jgi:hypothetical protein